MPEFVSHIVFGDQEKGTGVKIKVKEMGTFKKLAELTPLPENMSVLALQSNVRFPKINDE